MAKRKKSGRIEEAGVRIRVFRRGDRYWLDVRLGEDRRRVSAETSDKTVAEENARALARQIAMQQLLGVSPDTATIGQVFAAYHENKGQYLKKQWKRRRNPIEALYSSLGRELPCRANLTDAS